MVHSEELQEKERGSDKTCHKWRARPSCEKQAGVMQCERCERWFWSRGAIANMFGLELVACGCLRIFKPRPAILY